MLQQQFVRCRKCGKVVTVNFETFRSANDCPTKAARFLVCCGEMMVKAGRLREPLSEGCSLPYDDPSGPARVLVDDINFLIVTRKDTWLYENFAREDFIVERFDDRERRRHIETTAPYNQGLF